MSWKKSRHRQFLSTPSARRATGMSWKKSRHRQFLSTPSARRATNLQRCSRGGWGYFYPRPPRGGRRCCICIAESCCIFLSTPSARRATPPGISLCCTQKFLSTPSARRATVYSKIKHQLTENFYPRPPRGGRRAWVSRTFSSCNFYPRPPRGGRRSEHIEKTETITISIHALREEGDPLPRVSGHQTSEFLSTPSARRATHPPGCPACGRRDFYPRPPRGGRRCRFWGRKGQM